MSFYLCEFYESYYLSHKITCHINLCLKNFYCAVHSLKSTIKPCIYNYLEILIPRVNSSCGLAVGDWCGVCKQCIHSQWSTFPLKNFCPIFHATYTGCQTSSHYPFYYLLSTIIIIVRHCLGGFYMI
jgi:hypothetical protein